MPDFIKDFVNKKNIIIGSVIIILMIVGYIVLQYFTKDEIVINANSAPVKNEEAAEPPKEEVKLPKNIVVHISGRVKTPGVVTLIEGSRVNDAVVKAGGLVGDADTDRINLAEILQDGEKVYIPKKGEQIAAPASSTSSKAASNKSSSGGGAVNINTANKEALDGIPGVGPSTADKIIQYRQQNKGFKSVDEFKKVPGIGEKKFEKLKSYITI